MIRLRLNIRYHKLHLALTCVLVPCLSSCANIGYYAHSIKGQLELLAKKQPISDVTQHPGTSDVLKQKLEQVLNIRKFASDNLNLPVNGNYNYYADIGRDFVVWNVFATPALSLEPKQWCFLIVGCLSYRGYFSEEMAYRYAQILKDQGFDVFVGGVTAYSTLGWFNDPVLNTMIRKNNTYLAKVIFHELAHQKVYINNDTEFNEAFAETVALIGVRRWLIKYETKNALDNFEREQIHENNFVELVLSAREKLEQLYKSNLPDSTKFIGKKEIIKMMRDDYFRMPRNQDNNNTYDTWFNEELNNAKLSTVATYKQFIPAFMNLLNKSGNNLEKFYSLVTQLGNCSEDKRHKLLKEGHIVINC